MKIKILLIALLFVSCANQAQKTIPTYTYELSNDLKPYVYSYLVALDQYGIKFKKQSFIVVFDADIITTNLVGQAKGMYNDNLVYVKINPKQWVNLTHKQKRHLIFHELSHDIFNTEHTANVELMKPSMPSNVQSFAMDIEKEIIQLMKHIKNGNK
jgi:Zn-dependent peptidase ImmA (M78 family)